VIHVSDLLILSAALFAVGVYGILARRNAILVLISIELMLNAVNLNLVAASLTPDVRAAAGQAIALLTVGVGAAEIGVCLAIALSLFRRRRTLNIDDIDLLKW
jgi:NADH:ubiquinone oxidoreductase subunit K